MHTIAEQKKVMVIETEFLSFIGAMLKWSGERPQKFRVHFTFVSVHGL